MEERARRIGQNEDLFRRVNEQIEALNDAFSLVAPSLTIVCECGDLSCIEQIELSVDEYERLRANATWFAVKAGHEREDVEDVVEQYAGYEVVQKRPGIAAQVAKELDPRS
jgi:hypothetical protein